MGRVDSKLKTRMAIYSDRERPAVGPSARSRRAVPGAEAPGRVLPHSLEAEENLLSCCLLDGADVVARCLEAQVGPESFFEVRHGIVFRCLLDLYNRQVTIDVLVVAEELKTTRQLDVIGGYAFLAQVSSRIPTTAQAGYFIEKVREQALLRAIIRSATGAVEDCYSFLGGIDEFAAAVEERMIGVTSGVRRGLPEVMRWHELIGPKERPMPPELVKGILFRGSKLMLGGGSKSFKTWVLLDMALSVATGTPWWGIATVRAPVLFVNFELQDWSFERRVRAMMKAKLIAEAPDFLVWNLRGRARDFRELRLPLLNKVRKYKVGLVVLDPIYKCLGERDENSNGEVGDLLNEIESVAVDADCAMVHGHHFAKGDSSEKDKRDLASGAGAWMRDPDSSIMLRPHEQEDCFTVEYLLRDLPARDPMVVRWRHPCMEVAPGLSPSDLKTAGRPKKASDEDVVRLLGGDKLTHTQWQAVAQREGMSESTFKRRKAEALTRKLVTQMGPFFFKADGPVDTERN